MTLYIYIYIYLCRIEIDFLYVCRTCYAWVSFALDQKRQRQCRTMLPIPYQGLFMSILKQMSCFSPRTGSTSFDKGRDIYPSIADEPSEALIEARTLACVGQDDTHTRTHVSSLRTLARILKCVTE